MAENKSSGVIAWVVLAVIIIIGAVYFLRPGSPTPTQPLTNETTTPEVSVAQIPDGPIVMGATAPLSGDLVAIGTALKSATDLAVEEINANGGVKGHQIQLIWEDDKCNPQDGTSAAQKLVEVDKVRFIIGTVCSGATLAEAVITEPAKVLLFSAASSSPDLTTAGDYVFRTYPSDGVGGKVFAKYTYNELKKMKLAMISEQVDYTQGLRKTTGETFKALGGQVVADENYNTGDTDFRTQLLKIKESGADVVFVNANGPVPGTLILKQMNVSGLKATILVNDSIPSAEAISKNRGLYEGVYSTSPDLDPTRPQTKKYLDAYQAKYKKAPEYPAYMASSYDQVYMIAQAFAEVGTDTSAVRDWLYGVKNWPGALGDITIDSNGDPLIGYHVKQVTNGTLKDLGAYQP